MRWILRILAGLIALAVIVAGGVVAVYLNERQPVPDLAKPDNFDRAVASAPAELIEKASARLVRLRQDAGFPSVSIAVGSGGKIVWAEALGYADLAAHRAATTQTQYAIGSTSKPLSASVVVRLADQGRIDLDKDIRTYAPAFPKKSYVVTARQLLSHQGGIRHYRFAFTPPVFSESCSTVQYDSATASLAAFAADPLLFEPGTDFAYSSYGYTLLAAAVEGATHAHFLETMQTELFAPVGMASSGPDDLRIQNPLRASEYQNFAGDGYVVPAPYTNVSVKWAGGGFRATPSDLVRFGMALLGDKIVTPQSRDMMFTPGKLRNGKVNRQHYGMGFRIQELKDPSHPGETWLAAHHGGVAIGTQTMLIIMPKDNIVLAFSGNMSSRDFDIFDATTDIAIMFAAAARAGAAPH